MDFSVTSAAAIDKVNLALAEAVDAVEGESGPEQSAPANAAPSPSQTDATTALLRGGFVERVLGDSHAAVTAPPVQTATPHIDRAAETATMQTFVRPQAVVSEPLRTSDTALPTAPHTREAFALPASLLAPVTLVGLQVEHAASWPLPGRGFGPDPSELHKVRARERETPPPPEEEPEQHKEETKEEQPAKEEGDLNACGVVFHDEDEGAWCEELTRALRIALAAKIPPHALLLAAEQWRRGRCVVFACPQGTDPAGLAWAFVLWPRKQPARHADGTAAPLALFGLRVEARLQWSALPAGSKWCHVRVIKEHHPRTGRQLIAATSGEASGRVPCEVQLGPVLARPLRCCDVCVRISAARRFWAALGAQWSMHVVVSSYPLIGDGATMENAPC